MTEPTKNEDGAMLDDLFARAKDAAPAPSESLMARIAADAAHLQPMAGPRIEAPVQPGLLPRLRAALGGWTGIGGLATATMAGLFLGFSQPSLIGLTAQTGTEALEAGEDWAEVELWPGDELFFEEG